jgi:hypothetical protein
MEPVQPKSNTLLFIIIGIMVVCCCCLVVIGGGGLYAYPKIQSAVQTQIVTSLPGIEDFPTLSAIDTPEVLPPANDDETTPEAIPLPPGMNPDNIPVGSFMYTVTGSDGSTTNIDGGALQNQSTSAEYVLGLVSTDAHYAVSLFLPLDVKQDMLVLKPYDRNAAQKAPAAAILVGSTYYYADNSGIIMISDVTNGKISGSFVFLATDKTDTNKFVSVTGGFKGIPLK